MAREIPPTRRPCARLLFVVFGWSMMAGLAIAAEPFSIVILPDTQKYVIGGRHRDIFEGQTRWIAENAEVLNLKFVIHEGDVVQNADAEEEWKIADGAFKVLDGKVPYTISVGNHDMDVKKRDKKMFARFFPPSRFASQPEYGGHMEGSPENRYHLLEVEEMKFLILSIEYQPPAAVLEWANTLVTRFRDSRVILNTHSFLELNERNEIGRAIWDTFASQHPNLFLIVSGHLSVGRRADHGKHGNVVHQVLANYQGHRRGGNGWLRVLRFIPDEDRIEVSTFSTMLHRYMGPGDPKWSRLEDNAFNLEYDMGEPAVPRIAPEAFSGKPAKHLKEADLDFDPIESYGEDHIRGWTVYVHQDLEFDHPDLHGRVMELVDLQLEEIERTLPTEAQKALRMIPIWIELNHPKHPCACFHPDADWLVENQMNPAKQGAVEIANAKTYLEWCKRQPSMLLHELAHGYHFRFLRKDHAGVERAFENAKSGGKYENVQLRDGRSVRHYALTDKYEYFAETTEAYFGGKRLFSVRSHPADWI